MRGVEKSGGEGGAIVYSKVKIICFRCLCVNGIVPSKSSYVLNRYLGMINGIIADILDELGVFPTRPYLSLAWRHRGRLGTWRHLSSSRRYLDTTW